MNINSVVKAYNRKLAGLAKNPIANYFEMRRVRQKIQAIEGGRDEMTTQIARDRISSANKAVNKNNYTTYGAQVTAIYNMYNGIANYGGDICAAVVDTRVTMIAGEGISVDAKGKTADFIKKFFELNKLTGSKLLEMVRVGEMEGKNLLTLLKASRKRFTKVEEFVKVDSFSWHKNAYTVKTKENNYDEIQEISYKSKGEESKPVIIPISKAVFVKLGGTAGETECTSNRNHKVLTDMENYSRAKYDLRHNAHLHAKIVPFFKTDSAQSASAINADIMSGSWEIGKGYAGSAEFEMKGPPTGAKDILIADMLTALKTIATITVIPIHWLSWPELLNSRATAENLLEMLRAGVLQEQLVWQEAFEELIYKAMEYAIDEGIEKNEIIGDYKVKLPVISMAALKQIVDIWIPLFDAKMVSRFTVQNLIPGIEPNGENKKIKKEAEEAGDESMLNNKAVDDAVAKMQGKEKDEEGKEEMKDA